MDKNEQLKDQETERNTTSPTGQQQAPGVKETSEEKPGRAGEEDIETELKIHEAQTERD